MIPRQTGYYWLKLSNASALQVVYVIRGEDILFAGLLERVTNATFGTEYPDALWSHQINPPVHVMTD